MIDLIEHYKNILNEVLTPAEVYAANLHKGHEEASRLAQIRADRLQAINVVARGPAWDPRASKARIRLRVSGIDARLGAESGGVQHVPVVGTNQTIEKLGGRSDEDPSKIGPHTARDIDKPSNPFPNKRGEITRYSPEEAAALDAKSAKGTQEFRKKTMSPKDLQNLTQEIGDTARGLGAPFQHGEIVPTTGERYQDPKSSPSPRLPPSISDAIRGIIKK